MTNVGQQRARNLGSNYTVFRYSGKSIAYLEIVSDSGVNPVATPEPVHPLGYRHPTEFVTPRALTGGTLTLAIKEMWHQEVWQQLAGLANSHDLIDVFDAIAASGTGISCTKIINPPTGVRYGKTYHNCVIGAIENAERYDITTLSVTKPITIMYTHTTPL